MREFAALLLVAADVAACWFRPDYAGNYGYRMIPMFAAAWLLIASKFATPASMGVDFADWKADLLWTAKAAAVLSLLGLVCFGAAVAAFRLKLVDVAPSLLQPTNVTSKAALGDFLLHSCLMAPIFEELAYRGILLGPWRGGGRVRLGAALAVSAAYFLALHLAYFKSGMPPFGFVQYPVAGLILGFAFLKRGTLLPCVILHAIGNLCVAAKDLSLIDAQDAWRRLLGL